MLHLHSLLLLWWNKLAVASPNIAPPSLSLVTRRNSHLTVDLTLTSRGQSPPKQHRFQSSSWSSWCHLSSWAPIASLPIYAPLLPGSMVQMKPVIFKTMTPLSNLSILQIMGTHTALPCPWGWLTTLFTPGTPFFSRLLYCVRSCPSSGHHSLFSATACSHVHSHLLPQRLFWGGGITKYLQLLPQRYLLGHCS